MSTAGGGSGSAQSGWFKSSLRSLPGPRFRLGTFCATWPHSPARRRLLAHQERRPESLVQRSNWRRDVGWLLTSSSSSRGVVAQLPLGDQTPLLLEVAITPLQLQPRLRGSMNGHVSILQLAPVTQDLQGRLRRAHLARRVIPLVAPPDQAGSHPDCLKEAHRREGRGLDIEPVLPIPESQVPGPFSLAAAGVSQRSARSSTVTYPDAPKAAGDLLPNQDGRQRLVQLGHVLLELVWDLIRRFWPPWCGWVGFSTKLGSENPRAKLEPKWPGPLWSSISDTVHVSTCVSTLTKCMQANQTAPHTSLPLSDDQRWVGLMGHPTHNSQKLKNGCAD